MVENDPKAGLQLLPCPNGPGQVPVSCWTYSPIQIKDNALMTIKMKAGEKEPSWVHLRDSIVIHNKAWVGECGHCIDY